MDINKVNLAAKFKTFSDYWNPKIVGELNKQLVKIVKVKGEFVMHQHENEDELFFVINGTLFMELENKTIEINAGEFIIIPKGTIHKPYAPEEASIMLFEPATTLNTGNINNEFTVDNLEEI